MKAKIKILKQLLERGEQITTEFFGLSNQNQYLKALRDQGLIYSYVSKLPSRTFKHGINPTKRYEVLKMIRAYEASKKAK